jgi:hypothetical protein
MNHFAHRAAKAIKISRNFSTAREMIYDSPGGGVVSLNTVKRPNW